ncbi:MAG: ABC transporter substrate-binding protein, partial [Oscillospiraceae bacterium]|nr:ABC transporter substrate-binding protein [Oscillospiraceae bacterium]
MKKVLSFVLILALALSLAACGSSAKSEPAPAEAPAEEPVSATAAPPAEPAAEPEAAAEPAAEPEAAAETVTVTDMMGREVTIKGPVTRVVALQPADCEIIYALGAGDMVVGRGEYCDSPAEVLDVPSVQSGYDTNTEQIIALEPQVLFMSTMAQSEEQIQALEAAGVAVVVSETTDIQG